MRGVKISTLSLALFAVLVLGTFISAAEPLDPPIPSTQNVDPSKDVAKVEVSVKDIAEETKKEQSIANKKTLKKPSLGILPENMEVEQKELK